MSLSIDEEALLAELTNDISLEDQEKVKQLVEDGKKGVGDAAGATDMINLTMSLGVNVPLILFQDLINRCNFTDNEKTYYISKVKELIPGDIGCSQTNPFVCIKTGEKLVGYMVFRECDDKHHIDDEVVNLMSRVTKDEELLKKYQEGLMSQLQQLIKIGHGAYCHMRETCETIFKAMDGKTPEGFNIEELTYNPNKAEFFLFPDGKHVGVYIDVLPVKGK